jgi:hypothetical protein
MSQGPPVYLDEQGNPIQKVYLDEQGNPIGATTAAQTKPPIGLEEAIKRIPSGIASGFRALKDTVQNRPEDVIGVTAPMAGAIGGAMVAGPPGAAIGAAGGWTYDKLNRLLFNRGLEDVPKTAAEGLGSVGTEVGLQSAPELMGALRPIVGRAGLWLKGRSISPNISELQGMSDMTRMSEGTLRDRMARVAHEEGVHPTDSSVNDLIGRTRGQHRQTATLVDSAQQAGQTANMQQVLADADRYTLPFARGQGVPKAEVEATKARLRAWSSDETNPALVNRRKITKTTPQSFLKPTPSLGVPTKTPPVAPTTTKTETTTVYVPNRQTLPGPMYEAMSGTNIRLRDQYGLDPASKAGASVDKSVVHGQSAALKAMDPAIEQSLTKEHDLVNLLDVIRRKAYDTSKGNPVRFYEMMGAATGNPAPVMLGLGMRPNAMSHAGDFLMDRGVAENPVLTNLYRAALMARLAQK